MRRRALHPATATLLHGGLWALIVAVSCDAPGAPESTPRQAAASAPASAPPEAMPPGEPATPAASAPSDRPASDTSSDVFAALRRSRVERQMAHPRDGRRPIRDAAVLDAMRSVPRRAFVPAELRELAWEDSALPIDAEQTISQPYIVALSTELLELEPTSKVLEIGTGSGYQAAVLASITPHVWSIEIVQSLCEQAREVLAQHGYTNAQIRCGDGYKGWKEAAPFDAILLTCAAAELPPPLWEQLRPGGRVVIPLGDPRGVQDLAVLTKTVDGERLTRRVIPVRFVPLTGEGATQQR